MKPPHATPVPLNIRLLAWFNFLLDLRFYAPILVLYFAQVTGSYTLAMSLFSLTMLTSALAEIPTGILSDRLGRRDTLILGACLAALAVFVYAVGGNVWVLAIGATFEGVARALFSGNNDSLLHDTLLVEGNVDDFAEFSGKTKSLNQAAIAIVSVLGGVLAFYSYQLVMWLSVVPALAGIYVATMIKEPTLDTQKNEGNIYLHLRGAFQLFWQNKKLRLLSLSSIIGYSQGEAGYQFRSAFFATLWPVWAIGFIKAIGSLGATVSYWYAGKLIRRYGEFRILILSKSYSLATNILSTIFPNFASPLIMSSNSFLYGGSSIASLSLKQREYNQSQRATMASLDSFGGSLGYGVVSITLGLIADTWSPATGLLSLQLLAAIPLIIVIYLFSKYDH